MIVAQIANFRERTRRRLPRLPFDYMDSGTYGEVTLQRNFEALRATANGGVAKILQWIEAKIRVVFTLTGVRTSNNINKTVLARI